MYESFAMRNILISSVLVLVFVLGCWGRTSTCFTMPPKQTYISDVSIPDVNSPNYKHDTHPCPTGYVRYLAHSTLAKECGIGTHQWIVNSYAVCCEGGILFAFEAMLG